MNNSSLVRSWLLLFLISVIPYNSAIARELTSADLEEWFDPYNRSKISGLHDFMNSTDAVSDFSYDGIRLWRVDHTVSFENLPVKFVGATADGRWAFLTLANVPHADLQPLASSYFCRLDFGHITLDWASHESDQPHVVVDCGKYVDEATYAQCLNFIRNPRYVSGDHNALRSCEGLVLDFTEYTDKDVCLGYSRRMDFRHEEQKRGLDCDAWSEAHDEFAGHVYRLFGATVDQVRNVHHEIYGTNLYEEFDKIFSEQSVTHLRETMNSKIIALAVFFEERQTGKTMTSEEAISFASSLGLNTVKLDEAVLE